MTRLSLQRFRFIDLFAGIGGFHLAMEQLGGDCVFASEIDRDCQDVYERNFGVRPEGDIRPLTEGRRVRVPAHDVLCAGFPCQPFSKSGFQRGINETRGTLVFNILKILKARRPRFAILENVRNLAGPRQRKTWEILVRSLRELEYRVCDEPVVFSPHLLPPPAGRPQVRERVFILCEHVGKRGAACVGERLVENEPVDGWDPRRWRIEDVLQPDSEIRDSARYGLRPKEVAWIEAWNDFIRRLPDGPLPGFPIWADAFEATPRISRATPGWKANFLRKNSALYVENRRWIGCWKREHRLDTFPPSRRKLEWQARGCPRDLWGLVMHLRPSGIRAKPASYLPALVAITQTSIIGPRRRRITPREAARLQALPDDFVLHSDDAVTYRQLGNAVNVSAVAHVARTLFERAATRRAEPTQQLLFA